MNTTTLRAGSTLTALFLTVALVGCGGGGGSAPVPPTAPNPPPPAPAPVDVVSSSGTLQTTAATPTYAAGGIYANYFSALNLARSNAGAGVLNQSTALDTAAQAHSTYVVTNLATEGLTHVEVSTSSDYYAATFTDRDVKAGYAATIVGTETIGGGVTGDDYAYGLLGTAYHGAALLSNSADVGVGLASNQYGNYITSDLGATSALPYGQVPASGKFVAYPYSGQTSVDGTFYVTGEIPRVSTTLLPNATAGTPVIVNIRNADYVNFSSQGTLVPVVTSFSITDASGNLVPSVIIANSAITGSGVTINSDANLGAGFVELIAAAPLVPGTYTVTFAATLKTGSALTKTWSFTTD